MFAKPDLLQRFGQGINTTERGQGLGYEYSEGRSSVNRVRQHRIVVIFGSSPNLHYKKGPKLSRQGLYDVVHKFGQAWLELFVPHSSHVRGFTPYQTFRARV